MDIDHIAPIRQLARQPFRALNAVVEFFAPWQKDPPQLQSPRIDARHVSAQLAARHAMQPARAAAQLVTPEAAAPHAWHPACAPRINTARAAANQAAGRHDGARAMPLRVIRALDSQIPATASGRMVISGRMADVCAELERLSDAAQA